jgi:hypothetical protein
MRSEFRGRALLALGARFGGVAGRATDALAFGGEAIGASGREIGSALTLGEARVGGAGTSDGVVETVDATCDSIGTGGALDEPARTTTTPARAASASATKAIRSRRGVTSV